MSGGSLFWKWRPLNEHYVKNLTPTGADLTNLWLVKLLDKQGEQLHKLREKKKNKDEGDNLNLFKKFIYLYPPTYNGVIDPWDFEKWIRDIEKLFDAL